ncbi:hypothetical protein ACWDGI_41590 [Streptomyces sp. NPDC001220]
MAADQTDCARTAYLEGRSIAALVRDHGGTRGAIRTAVADLPPEHTPSRKTPRPLSCRHLDMPGKVSDFLRTTVLEPPSKPR